MTALTVSVVTVMGEAGASAASAAAFAGAVAVCCCAACCAGLGLGLGKKCSQPAKIATENGKKRH